MAANSYAKGGMKLAFEENMQLSKQRKFFDLHINNEFAWLLH